MQDKICPKCNEDSSSELVEDGDDTVTSDTISATPAKPEVSDTVLAESIALVQDTNSLIVVACGGLFTVFGTSSGK